MANIIVSKAKLSYEIKGKEEEYNRKKLPEKFLEWQSTARMMAFEKMMNADSRAVRSMPAHLPVLLTYGEGDFPANLTTRGIGLLPKEEYLAYYTSSLEKVLQETAGKALSETLTARLAAVQEFYENPAHFDDACLGGLEIFEGQTLKNMRTDPRAALLYTGAAPKYPSYQFNGLLKIITPDDLHYRFLLAARELFARDAFHIHQIKYPNGYLFYPVEILDKTPFPRRDH